MLELKRLQVYMAEAGIASRRKSEQIILEGRVKVDGVVVRELGTKVTGKEYITVDGKEISKMKRKEAAKLISLMPQTSEVYFPYTVRETVMLGTFASSGSALGGTPASAADQGADL